MKHLTATSGAVVVAASGIALASALVWSSRTSDAPTHTSNLDVPLQPASRTGAHVDAARNTPEVARQEASTPTPMVNTSEGHARDCTPSAGALASYAFEGTDVAAITPLGLGLGSDARATEVTTTYSGRLDTLVLESSDQGALVLGRLADFQSTAVREDARVRVPFLFRLAPHCEVQGFAHHADLGHGYARIQQSILHDLSFAAPRDFIRFEGTDSIGRTSGAVRRRTDGSIEKRVTTMAPWSTGLGSLNEVDDYVATITSSTQGWFTSATLRATYRGAGITSSRSLEANRLPEAQTLSGASRHERDYVWTDLLPSLVPLDEHVPVSQRDLDARQAVAHHEVDDVVERMIARVDAQDVGIQNTWPELRTYLEARPEMAHVIARRIVANEIPSQATMASFIALGNSRTPEAKTALLDIMRADANTSFDRTRAIFSLLDRSDVDDALAHELSALAAPLADTEDQARHLLARHALLGLGMMAGLRPEREDLREIARAAIVKALSESTSSIMLSPAYGALANVGDPSLLSLVEGIENHPDYSTREVAAQVIRRMPPAASAEFTRRWLSVEEDWRVKLTLYQKLELQTFDAREMTTRSVLELALADLAKRPGPITRTALVRLLGRAISDLDTNDPFRQRVVQTFADLLPLEVQNKTGLYLVISEHLDPATLRRVLTQTLGERAAPTPIAPTPRTLAPRSTR